MPLTQSSMGASDICDAYSSSGWLDFSTSLTLAISKFHAAVSDCHHRVTSLLHDDSMCSQFFIGDDEVVSNCFYDREDENATDTQYLLAGTPDVLLTLSHIRDAAADATQVATFVLADLAIWPPHLPVSLAEQPSLVVFDVAEPSTPSTFDGSVPRALVHSGLYIRPACTY